MRSRGLCLAIIFFLSVVGAFAQAAKPDMAKLVGTWKVDLRPTPDAAEYFQEFEVTRIDGKTFTGKFYGTEIKNGRVNFDWGTVWLAFTSEDQSGLYRNFAKLVGGKLEGGTHSLGRDFLLPWRAEKVNQAKNR